LPGNLPRQPQNADAHRATEDHGNAEAQAENPRQMSRCAFPNGNA